jgi:hypothetical protein
MSAMTMSLDQTSADYPASVPANLSEEPRHRSSAAKARAIEAVARAALSASAPALLQAARRGHPARQRVTWLQWGAAHVVGEVPVPRFDAKLAAIFLHAQPCAVLVEIWGFFGQAGAERPAEAAQSKGGAPRHRA